MLFRSEEEEEDGEEEESDRKNNSVVLHLDGNHPFERGPETDCS